MLQQFCTHREHRTNYCLSAPQGGASFLDSAPLRRGLFHVILFAQEGEQVHLQMMGRVLVMHWTKELTYTITPKSGPLRRMETLLDANRALSAESTKGFSEALPLARRGEAIGACR